MITEITYPLASRSGAEIPLDVKLQRGIQYPRLKTGSSTSINPEREKDL